MNGTYGTTRPATINPDEAEVFYFYRPSWSTDSPDFSSFKKLDGDCLSECQYTTGESAFTLPGMYNLRLPMDVFNKKGIYTVYIKPKEIKAVIIASGTLQAFPDVNGVVFALGEEAGGLEGESNKYVGYRIEFLGQDGKTVDYKIISSSNTCSMVPPNANNASETTTKYALSTEGNLVFCTLTPSGSLSFLSNSSDISNGVSVVISNTKFNPVMVEIEMVEHDAETITTMLEGDQLRNLDTGTITTFNKDGGIYHQAKYGNAVDPNNDKHYDFKINQDDSNINYNEEESLSDIKEEI